MSHVNYTKNKQNIYTISFKKKKKKASEHEGGLDTEYLQKSEMWLLTLSLSYKEEELLTGWTQQNRKGKEEYRVYTEGYCKR